MNDVARNIMVSAITNMYNKLKIISYYTLFYSFSLLVFMNMSDTDLAASIIENVRGGGFFGVLVVFYFGVFMHMLLESSVRNKDRSSS